MKPLRVLHVTFDMRIGGTEQVIRNLIEANNTEHCEMSVFCIEEPVGPFGQHLIKAGVSIASANRREGFDLQIIRQLRAHIRALQVDVVHCHQYTPWVYGALAAFGTGARVMFTEHGRFFPDAARPKRRYVNPILMRMTKNITAISHATAEALEHYEYIPRSRVQVIHNGIAALAPDDASSPSVRREFDIQDDALLLGTIARFDPIKDHNMMLRAFSKVLAVHSDSRLIIVGDGETRPEIEALIDTLGIGDRVILTGYRPYPAKILAEIDVFLLSSLSEGMSMTLLEAMSLSKPCVVTNAGGNPEVIEDGINGFVTPVGDEAAFANAIIEIALDGELRARLGQASLELFRRKFTSEKMHAEYLKLYREGIV